MKNLGQNGLQRYLYHPCSQNIINVHKFDPIFKIFTNQFHDRSWTSKFTHAGVLSGSILVNEAWKDSKGGAWRPPVLYANSWSMSIYYALPGWIIPVDHQARLFPYISALQNHRQNVFAKWGKSSGKIGFPICRGKRRILELSLLIKGRRFF